MVYTNTISPKALEVGFGELEIFLYSNCKEQHLLPKALSLILANKIEATLFQKETFGTFNQRVTVILEAVGLSEKVEEYFQRFSLAELENRAENFC